MNDRAWLRDNLAAHALGALDAEERRLLERSLEEARSSRRGGAVGERAAERPEDELVAFEAALALLPHAEPLLQPPDTVRATILAAIGRGERPGERLGERDGGSDSERAGAPGAAGLGAPRRTSRWPRLWSAAAILVVAIGALLVWNLRLLRELESRPGSAITAELARLDVVALVGTGAPRASARLLVEPGRDRGRLAVAGLAPLPQDRVYQLWFKRGTGAPQSGGTFRVGAEGAGLVDVMISVPIGEASAIAVTEEDAPGRSAPTGEHLLDLRPR